MQGIEVLEEQSIPACAMMGAGSQLASRAARVTVISSLRRLRGTHASVIIASLSGYLNHRDSEHYIYTSVIERMRHNNVMYT
jgi:hypothetical protein